MKCFMKEPRLRCSAEELLVHPWIAQIPKNKVEQSSQLVAENVSSLHDRDAMLNTIKLYEKEKHTSLSESSPPGTLGMVQDEDEEDEDVENWDDELGIDAAPKPLSLLGKAIVTSQSDRVKRAEPSPVSALKKVFQLSKEDESALFDSDVWDDHEASESPPLSQRSLSSKPWRPEPVASSQQSAGNRGDNSSWDRSALVPKEKRLTKLQSFSEKESEDDMDFDEFDEELLIQALARKNSSLRDNSSKVQGQATTSGKLVVDKFDEEDNDFGDLVDSSFADSSSAHRLSKRDIKTAAVDVSEAFPDFEDELGFDSLRDSNQKATARVVELLALLDPSMDDQVILDACMSLVSWWLSVVVCEAGVRLVG